ncbi:MAG: isoleucine--tRNA ligase [Flavobacteriales bacterium]|nr:isoleucine--tRNA ligase [Flavobacteriales bacterium]
MSAEKRTKNQYPEYKQLNLTETDRNVLNYWNTERVFHKSLENRSDNKSFVFYEGPPSANGMPGIHHVMSRAIKDVFCRYKTLKGYKVMRKAGWDTHGLPIELQVEKTLGITKDDIGVKISIEEYNAACRRDVLKFKDIWDDLTERIGYWVDLDDPYVTYDTNYIESVWYLLKELHKKGYLYKGYSIQPYSPAAGTGLSSHELNQPGTYRMVKDTTVVAQFRLKDPGVLKLSSLHGDVFCLAWTTTPWTLPSNTALGVGNKIEYCAIQTYNPYTFLPITVILASNLVSRWFKDDGRDLPLEGYNSGDKVIPWRIAGTFTGAELKGLKYEQLLPYVQPEGKAFEIVTADFVTTEDGTGIVHLAPSFGADDFKAARENGIASLTLVDKKGRFVPEMGEFAGMYVKNYDDQDENDPNYRSTDVLLAIKLKEENRAFRVEKYEHSYPHCWRTDKPVLYYPLESWFIKTTAVKDQLLEANQQINWKPRSTGEGRFGNWLENLVDWNLSRSRYWGTPLPIWRSEDGSEERCIGSIEELRSAVEESVLAGNMSDSGIDWTKIDLHRPYIDRIILTDSKGKPMHRETDLIDVWFDSGAMPYAQQHYPFENKEQIDEHIQFPADFIAEGVDQTRGWFFTLHVLGVMLFDTPAYKNVIANGLVLDKDGNKMSKRLGNTVDPFQTLDTYGADVVRWYMLWNSAPWENLKFNETGLQETQRKFFGTLYNVYSFFALYANIDGYVHQEVSPVENRPEIDRWIISRLNHLIRNVDEAMNDYEPTKATREIQTFTTDHLSNWYVRLCRRRFWKSGDDTDKKMAYDTLYECLNTIAILMSPFAPFYSDQLYRDLGSMENRNSVHLADFPICTESLLDDSLELKMELAQDITSMVLAIRKKEKIKVRQPLGRILVPSMGSEKDALILDVAPLILSEVNVKRLDFISENSEIQIIRSAKPNFKILGPKAGRSMKWISGAVQNFGGAEISALQSGSSVEILLEDGTPFQLSPEDVEISNQDMPGWQIETNGPITVALDISISEALLMEGHARELVNRIQNIRKDSGLEVTDRINVAVTSGAEIRKAIELFNDYICAEVLADQIQVSENQSIESEIDLNGFPTQIKIVKAE